MKPRTWTDDNFIAAVDSSKSVSEVLRKLGLSIYGSNHKTFKAHAARLGIDYSHFTGQSWNKGADFRLPREAKPLSEVLVEGSNYSTSFLKKRLVREGVLVDQCKICGLSEWLGQPLSLHLDHENGINNDHRLENLRLLCPNCHSQTTTYAGRNLKAR